MEIDSGDEVILKTVINHHEAVFPLDLLDATFGKTRVTNAVLRKLLDVWEPFDRLNGKTLRMVTLTPLAAERMGVKIGDKEFQQGEKVAYSQFWTEREKEDTYRQSSRSTHQKVVSMPLDELEAVEQGRHHKSAKMTRRQKRGTWDYGKREDG